MVKKRIYWIDALKGFATILVVLGHVFDGYLNAGLFENNREFLAYGFKIIYGFHMPLFFIVSGYVFQMAYIKDEKKKPSLNNQIINVLIIYIVFSVLFGLFKILVGKYTNGETSYVDVLMIPIKAIAPYWYLYALLAFYCFFSSDKILKLQKNELLFFAILLALNVVKLFINDEIGRCFEINKILYNALFFYIGVFLCKKKINLANKWYLILLLSIVSIVLMVLFRNYQGRYSSIPAANIIIAIGISLVLCMIFQSFFDNIERYHVKFFSFIGRYSLEVYLIHCIFTAANRVIFAKLNIDNFYLSVVLNVVISVSLPIIIAVICKKIKIHDLIFRPYSFIKNSTSKTN